MDVKSKTSRVQTRLRSVVDLIVFLSSVSRAAAAAAAAAAAHNKMIGNVLFNAAAALRLLY